MDDLRIKVLEDYYDFREHIQVMTTYRLLPNDAQIALTRKHYGIDTILAFDEDFLSVYSSIVSAYLWVAAVLLYNLPDEVIVCCPASY